MAGTQDQDRMIDHVLLVGEGQVILLDWAAFQNIQLHLSPTDIFPLRPFLKIEGIQLLEGGGRHFAASERADFRHGGIESAVGGVISLGELHPLQFVAGFLSALPNGILGAAPGFVDGFADLVSGFEGIIAFPALQGKKGPAVSAGQSINVFGYGDRCAAGGTIEFNYFHRSLEIIETIQQNEVDSTLSLKIND